MYKNVILLNNMLMKKITILVATGLLLALYSCNNTASNDAKAKADSINEAKVDRQDDNMTKGIAEKDAKFATDAANGGMAEVELGKLAQEKATDAKVKEFGSMMVTDHSKANDELKILAQSKGIELPTMPGEDEQKIKQELSAKSGKDFDKAYVDQMVTDHKKTITLFENALNDVEDADLKQFIQKTLPVLKSHLEHIQAIDGSK